MKSDNQNLKALYKQLTEACKSGDIEFINEIINSPMVKRIHEPVPEKMFIYAAGHGHVNILEAMLSSELKKRVLTNEGLKESLKKAFDFGHLDVIILVCKKLDSISANYGGQINLGLMSASKHSQTHVLKYFLETDRFKHHLNDELKTLKYLSNACASDSLKTVEYLLDLHKLHGNNLQIQDERILGTSYRAKSLDVLKYFIFDLNIEKTLEVDSMLCDTPSEIFHIVTKWFEVREFKNNLTQELNLPKEEASTSKKIKM